MTLNPAEISLLACPIGHEATLVSVSAPPATLRRLGELGLRVGQRVRPLQRTSGGGRVVASGELRMALDRGLAATLHVAD